MVPSDADDDVLTRVLAHARHWLDSLSDRLIPAKGSPEDAIARLGRELPTRGDTVPAVIDRLIAAVEPGLMASGSGRFYGWVMGGTLPAALAADWLVTAWDQNAGMRDSTPGVVGAEELAATWLLELLHLPAESSLGFTTGATMANFTCLAAARGRVLSDAGWDVNVDGLTAAPRVRVLVGEERHGSIDQSLRYLGLGSPEVVAADAQGRLDPADLRAKLNGASGPIIVCLQAGNIHSGAFDPLDEAIDIAAQAGAWVHVDGAFGLWAAASPALADLVVGLERADSWATDAHKTLNTPYDCGIAIVRDLEAVTSAMSMHASYLLTSSAVDPHERVPELSRRARGVPVWAALASLGSAGVRDLVDGLVASAQGIAAGIGAIPGATVLNDVVFSQVSVAFESDERTGAILSRILEEGTIMPSGSVWQGRAVIRFSVSNWRTGPEEVAATVAAVERAARSVQN